MSIRQRSSPAENLAKLSDPPTSSQKPILFALILLSFCLYAAVFILRTSYVVEGKRYFMLFDDSMVSMKYARNLAAGSGLVWNAGGERVEGYTNPFWVVYMSIFHLLKIDESKISLFIQISGALFLLLNLAFAYKIGAAISQGSKTVPLFAVLLTAFYLPLNNWGLQGTEVSVLTLLVTLCAYRGILYLQTRKSPIAIYVILGAATLIRLDAIVIAIAMLLFFIIHERDDRKLHLTYGISSLLFFLLFQTTVRYFYYGELLPNTYYLKMTGFPILLRISRGLFVFLWFAWHMNLVLFLIPFLVAIFKREKQIRLLFWIFAAQAAYSIFVGGDAWEGRGGANRYIAVVMPLFFLLFSFGITTALAWLHEKIRDRSEMSFLNPAALILIVLSSLYFNSSYGPTALAEWMLIKRPLNVEDNNNMLRIGLFLKKLTTEKAKIAVVWAGNTPYFSDRFSIDLLGKSDKKIAREEMKIPATHQRLEDANIPLPASIYKFIAFYPGHLKWNYAYSIGELKPDVIVQLYRSPEEAAKYLSGQYKLIQVQNFPLYFRLNSPNINWQMLPKH